MSQTPDHQPHARYSVTLRRIDGSTKTVRVITNRGELKAVFLAAAASRSLLGRWDALDVEITNDGGPEMDKHGVPILSGYAFDRNEW